jgi:hypothetical protein
MTDDDPLMSARARVLHDLEVLGQADARCVSILEKVLSERRWWVSEWPDGAAYVAGQVAQDVQDALLDSVGRWPLCKACDAIEPHELRIIPELGPDPHWVCERAGMKVAPLGEL